MSKRLALYDYVEVDGVDLSRFFHNIHASSNDEQVPVGGFNPTGTEEFLTGTRTFEVTADVWLGNDTNESRQVLYPLHRDRLVFDIVWRKNTNGTTTVSAANPELRGEFKLPTWDEGAERGQAETTSLTFVVADATNPPAWYAT